MIKKESLQNPQLGMKVFHENIYDGKECMTIVGIRKTEVELEGDYSGGTNNICQKEWYPIQGLFRIKKVCNEVSAHGSCQLHNLHCSHPNCEPYLTSDHHYDSNGTKIEYSTEVTEKP